MILSVVFKKNRHTIVKKLLDNEKLIVFGLLLFTFFIYVFNLEINGFANPYYSAAVQAASSSWHAFFFAGFDGAGFLSIDKPPVSIWIMAIFVKIFGFSSFNIILPNILAGVATVYLVYKIVRRNFDITSSIIAGAVMALTPISITMFRLNNPDSILTFFLTLSAYLFMIFVEKYQLKWLLFAGFTIGLAFNTKMMQALIIVPVYIIIYILISRQKNTKKMINVLAFGMVTFVSSIWWSLIVYLVPSSDRPYITNTSDSNIWDLIFGYNGVLRIFNNNQYNQFNLSNSGGNVSILKLFDNSFAVNFAWLLPFVLISYFAALYLYKSKKPNDKKYITLLLSGGWVLSYMAIFSLMNGIIHPYYTVILVPPIAIIIGIGMSVLWSLYKTDRKLKWLLPIATIATIINEICILSGVLKLPFWLSLGLVSTLLICAFFLCFALIFNSFTMRKISAVVSMLFMIVIMSAYGLAGLGVSHSGLIPTSDIVYSNLYSKKSEFDLNVMEFLQKNQGSALWIAGFMSTDGASMVQIYTHQPVLAIGGFVGSDDIIDLDKLKEYIENGSLKYFIINERSMNHCTNNSLQIINWVKRYGKVININSINNSIVYDITMSDSEDD